jgi:hypothetical protein
VNSRVDGVVRIAVLRSMTPCFRSVCAFGSVSECVEVAED